MTAFRLDEDNTLDWQILRDGGLSLYRREEYLKEDLLWFTERNYVIYTIDCRTWTSNDSLHNSLQDTLSFPSYYGRNYNALRDCLSDIDVPLEGGVVITLRAYDAFVHGYGSIEVHNGAEAILDIFANASRYFLLTGRRFIILAQSDNPLLHFDHLAGVATQWNRREWLNKNRGL